MTKISKISEVDVEDAQAETLKKMIIAMTADVRVILIKLADRLHNIRTLAPLPEEKRIKIARETLEIYAPIAYRLGMGKIRDELEDISFMYLYPEEYQRIKAEVSDKYEWAMKQVESLKKQIQEILKGLKIKAEIQYRIKREISIYRKLQKQKIDLENVYDLLALRIITDTVANCYVIMGAIHQQWVHIPSRWRDFITNPKSNFYQSIHTSIITREGVKFEIQIRTREMHRNAEEGIAAHWKYKEGLAFLENDHRLEWFREMIDYHKTNPDPKEFLSLVKRDLTPNEIYVFTPKGKVINLKAGASPIDFAYAIHSEVGDHCKNAIVNEKLVPLRTKLNSGDVVEIITQKNSNPSADWLKFAVTMRAKRKIMAYLQKEEFAYDQEKGRRIWQKVLREYGKRYRLKFDAQDIEKRLKAIHYAELETFPPGRGQRQKNAGPPGAEKPVPRGERRGDPAGQKVRARPQNGAAKTDQRRGPGGHRLHFRQMLPPDQGRGDHRLHDQEPRAGHPQEELPQRQPGDPLAAEAGQLERSAQARLPGQAAIAGGRQAGHAQHHHRHHRGQRLQHQKDRARSRPARPWPASPSFLKSRTCSS